MKIAYIKEVERSTRKIILKRIFNIIEETKIENKTFYILPINKNTKTRKRLIRKISRKLSKILYNECIENIVLSELLETNELLKNILYEENINILDGSFLYKALSYNVLEYIYKYNKEKINEVTILVNDLNNLNKQNIINISTKVKQLNIVTNHIEKFKQIDNYLYKELGIVINVSNNKQKSLSKSKIIINYDFPIELINKYNINQNAIIINTIKDVKINSKRFNGILINNILITMPNEYKINGFKDELIYESFIYGKNLEEIKKSIAKDKIKIKNLIGNDRIINKKELIK